MTTAWAAMLSWSFCATNASLAPLVFPSKLDLLGSLGWSTTEEEFRLVRQTLSKANVAVGLWS